MRQNDFQDRIAFRKYELRYIEFKFAIKTPPNIPFLVRLYIQIPKLNKTAGNDSSRNFFENGSKNIEYLIHTRNE